MIFGRKVTKQYKGKLQTVIEDLDLPNPVIRSDYAHGFAKQYVRDNRLLRTEPATNDVRDYGVNKDVANLPKLRQRMSEIIDNYHNAQQDILETFVDCGQLRKLAEPTVLATGKRIPGLKLDHPRQLAVMHALVRFANIAAGQGFRSADIHPIMGLMPGLARPCPTSEALSKAGLQGLVTGMCIVSGLSANRKRAPFADTSMAGWRPSSQAVKKSLVTRLFGSRPSRNRIPRSGVHVWLDGRPSRAFASSIAHVSDCGSSLILGYRWQVRRESGRLMQTARGF